MELLMPSVGLIVWTLLIIFLYIVALISVLKAEFKDSVIKFTWVFVIMFLPLLGSILYFLIGRSQRINPN